MFDLVAGNIDHVPSRPAMPIVISSVVEIIVLATVAVGSLLAASATLPVVSPMMAFIAEMPLTPPAPPPPPSPPMAAIAPPPAVAASAPIEAPHSIEPEPIVADDREPTASEETGIVSGVVGSIPTVVEAPPPPPAPAPAPRIRRIGGDLRVPALVHRVEPVYPVMAQASHVQGIVLLDAIVDRNGYVQSISVIKGHTLLTAAAIEAVKQWQYAPLVLNGDPISFELTVTLVFHLSES